MSANEKKLADFILNNASLIRDYSSQQIAGSVGVSQSSVVKFSQKLGYKGFTDLKLAIHESVVKQESNVAVLHGKGASKGVRFSLKDKMYQTKCDAISGATNLNDDDAILAVARAIQTSTRVQLVGSGTARAVARDTAFKLMGLGKPVIAEDDPELQVLGVGTLGQGDCLVIISALGQSPHQCRLAKQAKQAGVIIISVTNQAANPVATLAQIRLYSVPGGGDADMQNVIEVISQQHIMDLVCYTLALRDSRGGELRGGSNKAAEVTKAK